MAVAPRILGRKVCQKARDAGFVIFVSAGVLLMVSLCVLLVWLWIYSLIDEAFWRNPMRHRALVGALDESGYPVCEPSPNEQIYAVSSGENVKIYDAHASLQLSIPIEPYELVFNGDQIVAVSFEQGVLNATWKVVTCAVATQKTRVIQSAVKSENPFVLVAGRRPGFIFVTANNTAEIYGAVDGRRRNVPIPGAQPSVAASFGNSNTIRLGW